MKNTSTKDTKCIICNSETNYFFSKKYDTYPGSPFKEKIEVDYWKCEHCGFVISETHKKLSKKQWSDLNSSWHHYFEKNIEAQTSNQPPYANQALALKILSENDVISMDEVVDYAAGYGTLSKFAKKYFNQNIKIFDKYVTEKDGSITEKELLSNKYKLVINSAMFEHVLDREGLDQVNDLVASDGVLMLHTVICERIPKNPDWFYLTPMVHTAFHTNKSMTILMSQWGYTSSIYSPQAKSWFLFKKGYSNSDKLESITKSINQEIQTDYLFYKKGFVDYWKGF